MSSPAQITANQSNSKLSTGPITETGKQTVAGNSVTHGLAGSSAHAVLPGEESAFAQHLEGFMKSYRPVGAAETSMVRVLAENYWRLSRAHNLESALFEQVVLGEEFEGMHPVHAQAKAWSDPVKGLQRIALYANRIQNAINKTTAELTKIQDARKPHTRKPKRKQCCSRNSRTPKAKPLRPHPTSRPIATSVALFIHCPKWPASSAAPPLSQKPNQCSQ